MELRQAREAVITAGKKLVATGLIARTWGNVSCRISESQFVITPTGRAYETLAPEDVVIVNISDLSYEGTIKPSSEKGVHAEVYLQKPGINFVIHTHQANASVAAVLGGSIDITAESARSLVGERVELAAYGLPGTGKLRKGVAGALRRSDSKAVLMAHHGALCMGASLDEAFAAAIALEAECAKYLADTEQPGQLIGQLQASSRKGSTFLFQTANGEIAIDLESGKSSVPGIAPPVEAELHRAVYRARPDINVIQPSVLPSILAVSGLGVTVKPLLDDFAQLVGTSLNCADWTEDSASGNLNRVVRALKGRSAVLLRGYGALCCAGTASDAEAVEMVLDKGCKAYLAAKAYGRISPIAPLECALMRYVYLKKYSKMIKVNT